MLEFEEFALDIAARALRRNGQEVHLSPKLLDLLVLLVERHGTTVHKDEIMRVVWPGVVVEEGGLARNVSLLRKALGEEDGSRFIATVPKRGYRFVAKVREAGASRAQPARSRARLLIYPVITSALISGTLFFLLRHPSPAARLTFAALTTNAAAQAVAAAAISPDGSYLAYYDLSGLYVRPTDSQEARRIEFPDNLLPTQIEWFPDKAHLLISGFDQPAGKYSAWSVPILGGAATLLREDASYATASPDGRLMAFVTKANQIWLANPDGSSPRVFVALPAGERIAARLQFTADAAYLLNGRSFLNAQPALIEARRLKDGVVTKLVDVPQYPIDFHLQRDGQLVVARLIDQNGNDTRIESYRVDIGAGTSSAAVELITFPAAWVYNISATDDGKRTTFVKDPAQSDIYVADLDPSGDAIANVRRLTLDDARDRPTAWLADNRSIVFHSNRGDRWRVYLQALDQTSPEVLVRGATNSVWAAVSPDQKWLLYMAGKQLDFGPGFQYDLMRQAIAGGPPELISAGSLGFRRVRCARTGNRCVLMEKHDEQCVFFELDPDKGVGAELARAPWPGGGTWLYDWDLSPDGSRIAIVDPDGMRDRINVIALGLAGTTTVFVRGYQSIQSVNWDTDGSGFFVSSTDSLAGGLLHVAPDGSARFLRRQIDGEGWAIPSPDGRHLAFQEWTIAGNVWEMRR
jgi:DNA-binding winged helix-turn-helix (wHTH) protein/Tol biopolymer transport system component